MQSFAEELMPAGQYYKKLNKTNAKDKRVLSMYPGFLDPYLAHGWLGDIYGAWQLALALLYLAMFSTGVQLGYLAILIPISIEGFVVLVGLIATAYLTYRTDKSQRYILRHKVDITFAKMRSAAIAKANADNDQTLFIAGFFWNILAVTLMIVFATSVTVSPNIVEGAPATIINYNLGLMDNFKNPIKPDDNGNVGVVFLFVLLLLIKSAHLLTVFFARDAPVALRGKLHKIDASIDAAGEDDSNNATNKGRMATAAGHPKVMIGA